jgi:flagellar protein FliL
MTGPRFEGDFMCAQASFIDGRDFKLQFNNHEHRFLREPRVHKRYAIVAIIVLSIIFQSVRANEGGGGGGGDGSQYLPLESVLVNLEGKRHYLRADIQLLIDNAEHIEKIKVHMPAIRHSLIVLFSGRNHEQIAAIEEREKLRQEAKEEVKKALEHYHAGQGLEDLFFTDFMVQ